MTLEMSTFVGLDSSGEGDPENYALMENAQYEIQKEQESAREASGDLEEILSPLFKTKEIYKWAMLNYKKGRFLNG